MESTIVDVTAMTQLDLAMLDGSGLDLVVYFNVQRQLLQSVWAVASVQLSPFSKVAAVHASIVLALSEESKQTLLVDFSNAIGAPALLVRDSTDLERFFIGSVQDFTLSNQSLITIPGYEHMFLVSPEPNISVGDMSPFSFMGLDSDGCNKDGQKTRLPRPPNAYILYRKERHHAVKAEFPGICNNEISRILGKRWREENEVVRAFYKEKSESYKCNFMRTYPNYQYRPRKASEKKRRAKRMETNTSEELSLQSPASLIESSPEGSFCEKPVKNSTSHVLN